MAGLLPQVHVLDEADQPTDSERLYHARYYYAVHTNATLADAFRKYGLDPNPNIYARAKRMGFDEWREGYAELVNRDFETRGRRHLTAQLYRNRKIAEKIGDMVDSLDTDASTEWNPRQRKGNITAVCELQGAHSKNTTELLQIYELPTHIEKHTGDLPDSDDPIVLAQRAERLAAAARAELEQNGTDASGSTTQPDGEAGAGGAGSGEEPGDAAVQDASVAPGEVLPPDA